MAGQGPYTWDEDDEDDTWAVQQNAECTTTSNNDNNAAVDAALQEMGDASPSNIDDLNSLSSEISESDEEVWELGAKVNNIESTQTNDAFIAATIDAEETYKKNKKRKYRKAQDKLFLEAYDERKEEEQLIEDDIQMQVEMEVERRQMQLDGRQALEHVHEGAINALQDESNTASLGYGRSTTEAVENYVNNYLTQRLQGGRQRLGAGRTVGLSQKEFAHRVWINNAKYRKDRPLGYNRDYSVNYNRQGKQVLYGGHKGGDGGRQIFESTPRSLLKGDKIHWRKRANTQTTAYGWKDAIKLKNEYQTQEEFDRSEKRKKIAHNKYRKDQKKLFNDAYNAMSDKERKDYEAQLNSVDEKDEEDYEYEAALARMTEKQLLAYKQYMEHEDTASEDDE